MTLVSPPQSRRPALVLSIALTLALIGSACAGGARPVLVDTDTSIEAVAASLAPAPQDTALVGPAPAGSLAQPEKEDALLDWAQQVGLLYVGDCLGRQTVPGELCGRPEGIEGLYLIGPDTVTTWYVVSVGFSSQGYVVDRVLLAGS